jgi:hypothetical protein
MFFEIGAHSFISFIAAIIVHAKVHMHLYSLFTLANFNSIMFSHLH